MHFLTGAAYRLPGVQKTVEQLLGGVSPCALFGLPEVAKAVVLACLHEKCDRPVLVVTATEAEALRLGADVTALGKKTVILPARDYVFTQNSGFSREYEHRRIHALYRVLKQDFEIAFCDAESLTQMTANQAAFTAAGFTLKSGDTVDLNALRARLTGLGYLCTEQVDGPGQFAVRGGIVDIFSPAHEKPARLEFWGDEIDLLSYFSTEDQRRSDPLSELTVLPACEFFYTPAELAQQLLKKAGALKKANEAYLRQLRQDAELLQAGGTVCADRYLPYLKNKPVLPGDYFKNCLLVCSEQKNISQRLKSLAAGRLNDLTALAEDGIILKNAADFYAPRGYFTQLVGQMQTVYLSNFTHGGFPVAPSGVESVTVRQISPYGGAIDVLCDDLRPCAAGRGTGVVAVYGEKAVDIMAGELAANGFAAAPANINQLAGPGIFVTACPPLSAGLELPELNTVFLTYKTGAAKKRRVKKRRKEEIFNSLEELKVGDYVVHAAHGIGRFDGIHRIRTGDVTKDYIKIKYRGSDVLYLPVTQLDLVSRYIGGSGENGPALNRLGGTEWQKTRARVRAAVSNIAKELTALYAKRMQLPGYAFSKDTDLQSDFEQRFIYEETQDQLRAIREIKSDMERPVPMDRLLCGDVGFGKTEVALRAAFKCICDGKQCALLVPTTILAWQHYLTAQERIGNLPVQVELLSRFKTPKETEHILKRLKTGDIDLIVGTHRLISKDVAFKDLGLVIIDEEQRFGVAQKEKLKALLPTVDVLTLTATPIPRTLNMAMSGIRDMSSIEEAPQDRSPVQTYVIEQNSGILQEAVQRELRRGGQVYYLHNRVESIHTCALRLQNAFPAANIGVAHGKMGEEELSEIWRRLLEKEIDILVCTTIIETGVDVPNVNTLIIEDADRMGLAQLHQLRGRVGRSARRGYAYFCFRPGKALSEVAEKRLEAIREYTAFGSGFKIAMRDLEIRGAGSILGGEQHGHMEAVGYDMYLKLLNEAIDEQRGIQPAEAPDCAVDLNINANIPERYIPALSHRLEMYRRIADIKTVADKEDVIDELCDRFGDPPKEVLGLMDISLLRNAAAQNGIDEITGNGKTVELHIKNFEMQSAAGVLQKLGGLATLVPATPCYRVAIPAGQAPTAVLNKVAALLAKN